jgi:uncharacterized protein YdiU (UPF0061 family)
MPPSPAFRPATTHAALGPDFYDPVHAARFPSHIIRHRDQRAAATVGLDTLTDAEWIAHFGRFEPLPGSFEQPLALRYHGHQFRHYNPDLGDGRGFLFAQMHDIHDGRLLDFGTKGSGQTPWSRTADGRLTLKGGVREVLASTMLEALGVYTSKSFSLIETGENLERHDEPSPTRAAVLVRLSHSHIRIGSFQRFAALRQPENTLRLLDHTIRTHMPTLWHDDPARRAAAFLTEVAARTARLGAQWMAAGFVHGVLNTDNINVTGESFDYGPWRFLPTYNTNFTAAYFDHNSLYSYGRQPDTLLWNLVRLAECLLPFAEQEMLQAAIETFPPRYHAEMDAAIIRRLGLAPASPQQDHALATAWQQWLADSQTPFEQAFFDTYAKRNPPRTPDFAPVQDLLDAYAAAPGANPEHPYFNQPHPCTMLIEEVEAIWAPIAEHDDWSVFERKLAAIETMRMAYGGLG